MTTKTSKTSRRADTRQPLGLMGLIDAPARRLTPPRWFMPTPHPTLDQLAADHARRRLNRKRRNAELRAAGYDPDGPDGAAYRREFDAAVRREQVGATIADQTAAQGAPPAAAVLWQPPPGEHEAAVEAGLIDALVSPAAYLRRLDDAEVACRAAGVPVRRLCCPVAVVLQMLEDRGLPNTPGGRAAAFALIDLGDE